MNNPFAPYKVPEEVGFERQHFGLTGYENERQMLDGLKTIAAVHQAIERPRVHYGHYQGKQICRLNNSTAKWEALPIDPAWLKNAGGCPTCGRPFLHMPGWVPKPDDQSMCQCGWAGTAAQLMPCAS